MLKWTYFHAARLHAMPDSDIVIQGAREHNLRDVDLVLPRNQLICLTGVSGSGKSSLAFDTVFAEGQRRYVQSLSTFARQFLGQMPKPDVDRIEGLSPAISISQKSAGNNPRSTVGTITEIYDFLRVLYARVGRSACPECGRPVASQSREAMLGRIENLPPGSRLVVLAPKVRGQKGHYRDLFAELVRQGFVRARIDGELVSLHDVPQLDPRMRHDIDIIIDRVVLGRTPRVRLGEAIDLALQEGDGMFTVAVYAADRSKQTSERDERPLEEILFSSHFSCASCGRGFEPPSPQLFSFNSPRGMCPSCAGLGELYTFDPQRLIPDGSRSFKQGCIELVGSWRKLGRWKRHVYQGVADTIERVRKLPRGTMLETPWEELPADLQQVWLWGAGDQHITYTWRGGSRPVKYGGQFEGVIPRLLEKHRSTRSVPQRRMFEKYMRTMTCPECSGERLNAQARAVRLTTTAEGLPGERSKSLPQVCRLSIAQAAAFFQQLELDDIDQMIAAEALKEIRARLQFLLDVGLDYLSLDRTAPTLSGGESQRIRLAGQVGCGLVGVLYVLDEPSIGLHPRDNDRLLATLGRLRDLGNTVVVVEHDEATMRAADHVIDFGPGAGVRGGHVVAQGRLADIAEEPQSVTGAFLTRRREIAVPQRRRPGNGHHLRVLGARHNNLQSIDASFPLGTFIVVTGVSGSGKSSLVTDIVSRALQRDLNGGQAEPGEYDRIEGLEHLDKLIAIDQSPIGRTPRSNPGTYIKVFDEIRKLFSRLPDARQRGFTPGRFSFNVKGGRCEACEGNGSTKLEMDFLADVWIPCRVCEGKRYNRETLDVRYKGRSIADILDMDVQELLDLFENVPSIRKKLETLHDVGLDYIKLGQPSPTLSGGEAQRIKLARELSKRSTGKTLYLLDEPTTGLHFADIEALLRVLHRFVDAGNTVIVIEHNLDVIKTADWIIDLGPEGGAGGGRIVAQGTPESVAQETASETGRFLRDVLEPPRRPTASGNGRTTKRPPAPARRRRSAHTCRTIEVHGAEQHNLQRIAVKLPRDKMTVLCGPSGSGKTSLAMDTIYAEGQRRYVESLSAYARQFVSQMPKPKVDHVHGLSPAVAIEQRNVGHTPRSTVGTVTEIHDYFRVLMARLGTPFCPHCDRAIGTQTSDEISDRLMREHAGRKILLTAPAEARYGDSLGNGERLWQRLREEGFVRVRIDGTTYELDRAPAIDRRTEHQVEIVVDRIAVRRDRRGRIAESVEQTLILGDGTMHVVRCDADSPEAQWERITYSVHLACESCGRSFEPLSPYHYSFNHPHGWCPQCRGLGTSVGTQPDALLDESRSLRDGAMLVWPDLSHDLSRVMLEAIARETGWPLDEPVSEFSPGHKRTLLYGTGERWFHVDLPNGGSFAFQFKGLCQAVEEASRKSPTLRRQLDGLVGDVACPACQGARLRADAAATRFGGYTIGQYGNMPLSKLARTVKEWKLSGREREIAGELVREIRNRLQFLLDVGLDYLSLNRPASTLSNGEAQRIRLASQLGSGLCGVTYVLDEPTIGLHPRDNARLVRALHRLRDLGNTLLVVEHDREVIAAADRLCDFGPGAGRLGGRVVSEGTVKQVTRSRTSVTGPYLKGTKAIPVPTTRRATGEQRLTVRGARLHNLKSIDVAIPLGTLTAVTGPSGSGKSSLIDGILYPELARRLHHALLTPGPHDAIEGVEHINKVIRVDQQPLGNSPTSNPATYTGLFELIRELYASLPESRVRGYSARQFSFNVAGGRCESCDGQGHVKIEMHFLPDVWVPCEACGGKRYKPETLQVKYRNHSIDDLLNLPCGAALELLGEFPRIRRILQTLCEVGLDYLTLGQPAPTLSGGEAQRVKLASHLARPDTGRTLYLLDEPTTGLHFDDLARLLQVLHRLVDAGNTVLVIEHNLDVIKTADWIIDLGPEAGREGGRIVAQGTPEDVARQAERASGNGRRTEVTWTGKALRPVLAAGPRGDLATWLPAPPARSSDAPIAPDDATETTCDARASRDGEPGVPSFAAPWEVDGRRWHTRDRMARGGRPCRWDGRILEQVVDRIVARGDFAPVDWSARTVVEITGPVKRAGWFFHAITAEEWLLKMKFRVPRSTFNGNRLMRDLALKTLNEMDELPVYGNDPRVRCRHVGGPWQEVEIRAHSWQEIDTPAFWSFVDRAVDAFLARLEGGPSVSSGSIEAHAPWKKLGRKWHFLLRGFPSGGKPRWPMSAWEELHKLLERTVPDARWEYDRKHLVRVLFDGATRPWARVFTKRPAYLNLQLFGPHDAFTYGELLELGSRRSLHRERQCDRIEIAFVRLKEVRDPALGRFLKRHAELARS